jgi:hypothetical protein
MPVYLCQPGAGSSEPWRHGIQVYAAPFAMDEASLSDSERDAFVLPASTMEATNWSSNDRETNNERTDSARTNQGANTPSISQQRNASGLPIRRVRHAEVVLVDDTCVAFDRYWLRLRWPGHKGGFAGYIALGKVGQPTWHRELSDAPQGKVTGLLPRSTNDLVLTRSCLDLQRSKSFPRTKLTTLPARTSRMSLLRLLVEK